MQLTSCFCDNYSTRGRLCGAAGRCFQDSSCLWLETHSPFCLISPAEGKTFQRDTDWWKVTRRNNFQTRWIFLCLCVCMRVCVHVFKCVCECVRIVNGIVTLPHVVCINKHIQKDINIAITQLPTPQILLRLFLTRT